MPPIHFARTRLAADAAALVPEAADAVAAPMLLAALADALVASVLVAAPS
jgi:hypothetical protein